MNYTYEIKNNLGFFKIEVKTENGFEFTFDQHPVTKKFFETEQEAQTFVDVEISRYLFEPLLFEFKKISIENLPSEASQYIYKYYSRTQQDADNTAYKTWTTFLVNRNLDTIDNISKVIYEAAGKILEGESTYTDELQNLPTGQETWAGTTIEINDVYAKLLRIGIRSGWAVKTAMSFDSLIEEIKKQIFRAQTYQEVRDTLNLLPELPL